MIGRKYDFKDLISNKEVPLIDAFIYGNIKEDRTSYIPNNIDVTKIDVVINIEYDIENEAYRYVLKKAQLAESSEILEKKFKDLVSSFSQEGFIADFEDSSILIDTTGLKHPFIFYLLKILKEDNKPKNLFLGYTEPKSYNYTKDDFQFNLTERFCSNQSIPGFLRQQNAKKQRVLVALMGFEGNRFNKVYEEIKPDLGYTYAVVGFPTFQPGWQYYVYGMNIDALRSSKSFSNITRASADDPFDVYNEISKIFDQNKTKEVVIAAIGTKPHSIGAAMFSLVENGVRLYYDFPSITKTYRTTGVGQCHLYNLSVFINS